MYAGLVGKSTPIIDILTVLTGTWDEREDHGFHVVMCPFFVSIDGPVSTGMVTLPYKVKSPVPALLYGASGEVHAIVVKPGEDAVLCPEDGVLRMTIFGSATQVEAVR